MADDCGGLYGREPRVLVFTACVDTLSVLSPPWCCLAWRAQLMRAVQKDSSSGPRRSQSLRPGSTRPRQWV
jgi:hypothetical protein